MAVGSDPASNVPSYQQIEQLYYQSIIEHGLDKTHTDLQIGELHFKVTSNDVDGFSIQEVGESDLLTPAQAITSKETAKALTAIVNSPAITANREAFQRFHLAVERDQTTTQEQKDDLRKKAKANLTQKNNQDWQRLFGVSAHNPTEENTILGQTAENVAEDNNYLQEYDIIDSTQAIPIANSNTPVKTSQRKNEFILGKLKVKKPEPLPQSKVEQMTQQQTVLAKLHQQRFTEEKKSVARAQSYASENTRLQEAGQLTDKRRRIATLLHKISRVTSTPHWALAPEGETGDNDCVICLQPFSEISEDDAIEILCGKTAHTNDKGQKKEIWKLISKSALMSWLEAGHITNPTNRAKLRTSHFRLVNHSKQKTLAQLTQV